MGLQANHLDAAKTFDVQQHGYEILRPDRPKPAHGAAHSVFAPEIHDVQRPRQNKSSEPRRGMVLH